MLSLSLAIYLYMVFVMNKAENILETIVVVEVFFFPFPRRNVEFYR